MERLLITGAAGALGTMLRQELKGFAPRLRLSDVQEIGAAAEHEEVVVCDLGDYDAVMRLVEGCDGVVHLGGVSVEGRFEDILNANIRGTYHVFEAARKHGRPRIFFASSNHAIGFHERTTRLDANAPTRPDSIYGVSKCFGEQIARYYFDKFGVESVCARIGSCFPEPKDRRMLATWLAYGDLATLVQRTFEAPCVGHTIIYGASDNRESWWDNRDAAFLGWHPQDSADRFREKVEEMAPPADPKDPAVRFQGGVFAAAGHFEDD
jgi:uronate dehydrogenase